MVLLKEKKNNAIFSKVLMSLIVFKWAYSSEKPGKIDSKIHVSEPFFYAVVGSKFRTLKRDSRTDFFRGFCKNI